MITALDKNTALVLIDLQNGIVGLPLAHSARGVIENAVKLVAAFRAAGLPIVIVNVHPAGSAMSKIRKEFTPPQGAPPKPDFLEPIPEISIHAGDIRIYKESWNAFYNTPVDEELKRNDITGIVLAGISTSIGVEATARSAAERGYNITIIKDAMTDMYAEAHENSMKYIFPRIAEIGTTIQVIEQLQTILAK